MKTHFYCKMKQMRVEMFLKYDFNNGCRSFICHFYEQSKLPKKCDGPFKNGPIANRIGNTITKNYILK